MAKRKLSSDINVVPYIDVMLVLLIIFMVTAPLLVQGIQVELPEANAQSLASEEDEVVMSVNAAGELFLNVGDDQSAPLTEEQFAEKVGAILRARPDKLILVQGDAAAAYEHVARGMALLQEAGARKIAFVTRPADESKR
jgi:biopolymer transport protein TolR